MTAVTPQMVKELRESTGAGMSDCKKALDQAAGDLEKAVVILRERGLAAAAKKSGRAASEGIVSAVVEPGNVRGYAVEVNCETDFVTRNEGFQDLVATVTKIVETKKPANLEALLASPYPTGGTLQEAVTAAVAKIGENLQVRRYEVLGSGQGLVTSYVHGGGKIGVLVELVGEGIAAHRSNPALVELAKDVALQAAAMKPLYLDRAAVPKATVESETEVFYNTYRNQGKPEAALGKIVSSRIETWYKESCLTEQLFVKDDSKTVQNYVADAGKKLGVNGLKVAGFVRLELGQGVEKKSEDFASEVAAQISATKN